MPETPAAWGLLNPATGRIDATKCYVREENARLAAKAGTNRWRTLVAVPLFLHPAKETADDRA